MFDNYIVKIRLTEDMLGTNPGNPGVMDTHIIDKQRKLIANNSKVNKAINKYLGSDQITENDAKEELGAIRVRINEVLGTPITDQEFEKLRKGDFKKITDLRESMDELDDKGITCFFRNPDNGSVCIGSHMILGFLKAAGESISRTLPKKNGTMLHSSSYTSSVINQHCKVNPKLIDADKDVKRDESGEIDYLQRSLRAMTAQGPRISLAKSEVLPSGTEFKFQIKVLKNSALTGEILNKLFSMGELKGLGQWRNAGYGTFEIVSMEQE